MRKVVQISFGMGPHGVTLTSLCDDGTMWLTENPYCGLQTKWIEVNNVPQQEQLTDKDGGSNE